MKLNSRRKPIDPVMPNRVSTGGTLSEDSVNPDNLGLYKNLNQRDQYLTYNAVRHEVSVMKITRSKSEVVDVIKDVSPEVWELMTTLMKEYVSKDGVP